jgi:hypothetical protein
MEKACVHGSNPLKDGAMLILGYPIEMLPDDVAIRCHRATFLTS